MKFKILKEKTTGLYSVAGEKRWLYFWREWLLIGRYREDNTTGKAYLEDKSLRDWDYFTPVTTTTEEEMVLFLKKWWQENKPMEELVEEYETVRVLTSKELENEK